MDAPFPINFGLPQAPEGSYRFLLYNSGEPITSIRFEEIVTAPNPAPRANTIVPIHPDTTLTSGSYSFEINGHPFAIVLAQQHEIEQEINFAQIEEIPNDDLVAPMEQLALEDNVIDNSEGELRDSDSDDFREIESMSLTYNVPVKIEDTDYRAASAAVAAIAPGSDLYAIAQDFEANLPAGGKLMKIITAIEGVDERIEQICAFALDQPIVSGILELDSDSDDAAH